MQSHSSGLTSRLHPSLAIHTTALCLSLHALQTHMTFSASWVGGREVTEKQCLQGPGWALDTGTLCKGHCVVCSVFRGFCVFGLHNWSPLGPDVGHTCHLLKLALPVLQVRKVPPPWNSLPCPDLSLSHCSSHRYLRPASQVPDPALGSSGQTSRPWRLGPGPKPWPTITQPPRRRQKRRDDEMGVPWVQGGPASSGGATGFQMR